MKVLLMFFVLIGIFMASGFSIQEKAGLLPTPKISQMTNSYLALSKNMKIVESNNLFIKYKASFNSLEKTLKKHQTDNIKNIPIVFSKIDDISKINEKFKKYLIKPESYVLIIEVDSIQIKSTSDQGLLNGLSSLEMMVEQYGEKLPIGWIIDYPDINTRVLHLSLWPSTIEDFKETIRLARLKHFNVLIWLNHFGVKLKSLEHLKINDKDRWTTGQFKEMVVYAKQNGLEIIPELKLLSHQKKFMADRYPQYMFNKATYDPRIKELYDKVVFPAIDELLLLTGATKFHIGHDEVASGHEWHYRKNILNKNEKQLPPELFVKDVLVLNDYLRQRGVETWMWSDMFYTKDEFSSMKKAGASLNGINGFSALRSKIPKDIVMNVWHYRGNQKKFPTTELMLNNGHRVLGATWKFQKTITNYANYIYKLTNVSKNTKGMIATTWYGLSGKKKKDVHEIIKFSGEAFWNAN